MKLSNTFTSGAMNKDLDIRLVQKSFYLDANNVRVRFPDGQNSRSVKFPLGNTIKTSLNLGTNPKCIGVTTDNFSDKIYWAVKSDQGSYVCEYNVNTEEEAIVKSDTRSSGTNVFNFPENGYIEMRVLNDNDNQRNFLFLTDGVNEPFYFEIANAKTLANNGFTLQDVSLIKAPPLSAPVVTLSNTESSKENNIETKFLSFSYRYEYEFGEYSALSPFSEFAFFPKGFSFDFSTGTNRAMFNAFSKADVSFNTGSKNVIGIDIVVKESGSNTVFIVESLDKNNEGWGNNSTQTISFSNSKIYRALDSRQLSRVFDNVPTKAATMELIGNRAVFGNYSEGYDIKTAEGNDIKPVLSLSYTSSTGESGTAHTQVKSNRDYEIAISYLDGKGRMTTPLTSESNTVYVKNEDANKKNKLQVTIGSRPPSWAKFYRFFVKQSKNNYDIIAPIIFYREGTSAWLKIEGNDVNKVKKGDFVYIKSDTSGLKISTTRTKILEVLEKERNFLEKDLVIKNGVETLQLEGTYIKVSVEGFSISENAVGVYEFTGFAFRSRNTTNNFIDDISYIEDVSFYGTGLSSMSASGTYTGNDDIRYEVEIDSISPSNTFRWRENNVTIDTIGSWTSGVVITGSNQALSNGVNINFTQTSGYGLNDRWVVSAKSQVRSNSWNEGGSAGGFGRRAIILYQGKNNIVSGGEAIEAGAVIRITYDDSDSDSGVSDKTGLVSETFSSSKKYNNLEEWFYEDNIISLMSYPPDTSRIMFRRGFLTKTNGEEMKMDTNGRMYMAMLSSSLYTGDERIKINTSLAITELDNPILIETIPTDENSEIFFELPRTYPISFNNHTSNVTGDVSQNVLVNDAVINLEYFNSFGWYNSFESIKIGDTFNEKVMLLDTKPLVPVDNYKEVARIASLTYSGIYEGTTQFNALNEFNLSQLNFKDLDTRYGAIKKLHTRDTDLISFQQDKTHRVLFQKNVLFNSDGSGNLSQSSNVLGQEIGFVGEYGIGNHPESFAFFGNRIYHIDKDRGALMRLSLDGYTEISQRGMGDFFRNITNQSSFVGGYDPFNDEYLINLSPDNNPKTLSFAETIGFTSFYEYEPERMVGLNNRLYSIKNGQVWLHDSNQTRNNFYGVQRNAFISTVLNDSPNDVKMFKSINLESDIKWDVALSTNFNKGNIRKDEFVFEEGESYAYIRQGEEDNFSISGNSLSAFQGLGNIASILTNTLTMDFVLPRNIAVGDIIYKHDPISDNLSAIGEIINLNGTSITLSSVGGLLIGDYILYGKDVRVEGESIKGYYLKVDLTSDNTSDAQLFAIKSEAVKSFD